MSHVGQNNEPLLSRAMYGYDGSLWKPISLDANGYVEVSLAGVDGINAQGYDWISAAWQKTPLRIGYSSTVDHNWNGTGSGTGYVKTTDYVPTGEIWTIEAISFVNYHRNITRVNFYVQKNSGAYINVYNNTGPVAGVPDIFIGRFTMSYNDLLVMVTTGNQTGDSIESGVTGYITETDN